MDMPNASACASIARTFAKRPRGWRAPHRSNEADAARNARVCARGCASNAPPSARSTTTSIAGCARKCAANAPRIAARRRELELSRTGTRRHRLRGCRWSGAGYSRRRCFAAAACATFLTIMSRFSRDRWSMNRTPLRWSISCCRQTDIRPSNSSSRACRFVEPAGADAVGAVDLGILVGDRQAAFVIGLRASDVLEDFGVDEDVRAA